MDNKRLLSQAEKTRVLKVIDTWLNLSRYDAVEGFNVLRLAVHMVTHIPIENMTMTNIGDLRKRIAAMPVVEDN